MTRQELFDLIRLRRSFLCIGLDTEWSKIPEILRKTEDPVYEFNRRIIDATSDLAVAYKPNLAFYEASGHAGWQSLAKTISYIRTQQNRAFIIADAKRGDIGNTSTQYARSFFAPEAGLNADAVTVAPYMGEDSVTPFLQFPGKWVILLALTSNAGAANFQFLEITPGEGKKPRKLFQSVLEISSAWGSPENMMYVVGATRPDMLQQVREIVPDHFLLVPGIGAQGGSLEESARFGMNRQCGMLVNASRSILYASSGNDFEEAARAEALSIQRKMEVLLAGKGLIEI
jgi:orotidine-5'-phosphate decarboxylase